MKPVNISELQNKKPLVCTGSVSLVAAARPDSPAPSGEDANKPMSIVAYTGGLMDVGWGDPVGIVLDGLKWREDGAVPILCHHNTRSLNAICGQASRISHDGKSLTVDGELMPVTDDAKKILDLAKAGFKFQASVGVSAFDALYIDDGEAYMLNGEEVSGPCYIVRAGVLNEVSIVPLGADGSTQTAIVAAASTPTTTKEDEMSDKAKPVEAEKLTDTATVEAAQTAERDRVASVIAACKGHDDIMATAVKEGWTAEKAELACLKAEKAEAEKAKKLAEIEAGRTDAPSVINLKASAPRDAKTVVAAACMAAAMSDKNVEAHCKGADLDAAHDLGIRRLSDVFAAFGFNYRPGDDAQTTKALRAAFSSADIPNVLSNVAHKFALVGFGEAGEYWRVISRAVPVSDFKTVKGVRLVMSGLLKSLAKGGELQHVDLSDESRNIQAATKGSIVGITREDLINDDLAVLSTIPERFGLMAGRTINKDVFGSLSTTGSDYGANGSGALNITNLAAAYAAAMGIKDSQGDPLGPLPDKILCAPGNFLTAVNIYQSELITGASSKEGKTNVLRGVLQPITSPYLSGTAYRLFNSSFPLVDVAFLNGVQTPVVETANANFEQLGISMRCYYDFGVAAGEIKAAYYSTGA